MLALHFHSRGAPASIEFENFSPYYLWPPYRMPTHDKVKSIEQLAEVVRSERAGGKTVALCHGVFDLLHIGHIRYLQAAARRADTLIVTVTPDHYVNKGPHRPAFHESLRVDALAALDCVDYVAVNQWPTAVETIAALRPDLFIKGGEYRDRKTPELLREQQAAEAAGTAVDFIDDFTSSSSHLINNYLSPFSEEAEVYLHALRQRRTADEMLQIVEGAARLKVLVVGEAIIDEYVNCAAIGRSAKAPIVATKFESSQRYAGGALAVANNLAAFCQTVDLVTLVGDDGAEEPWIHDRLDENVSVRFVRKSHAPTIIKRRYRESYFDLPLFAINFLNDDPLTADEEKNVRRELSSAGDYDLVVVADYGHSLLCAGAVELLCRGAKFLAVSVQADSANTGFHTIAKYPRADFAALARRELELEFRTRGGAPGEMLTALADKLGAKTAAVTLGKRGCLVRDRQSGIHEAAGLSTKVVDRIGAGDAFFAITSLCASGGAPPDVLGFLGNVAGAEAVATVGSSWPVDRESFARHVQSLFK